MSLLAYADDAALAADLDKIFQAFKAASPGDELLVDAAGKPLTAAHPLLARNPTFRTTGYVAKAFTAAGRAGGLVQTDAFADGVLGATVVAARAVVPPAKPGVAKASTDAYATALTALVPASEPVIVKGAAVAVAKGG